MTGAETEPTLPQVDPIQAISALVVGSILLTGLSVVLANYTAYTLLEWISVFGTLGSLLLSAVLALLYLNMSAIQERQTEIQSRQADLMSRQQEIEYTANLEIQTPEIEDDGINLSVVNSGNGRARDLTISFDVVSPDSIAERTEHESSPLGVPSGNGSFEPPGAIDPNESITELYGVPTVQYERSDSNRIYRFNELMRVLSDGPVEEIEVEIDLHYSDSINDHYEDLFLLPLTAKVDESRTLEDAWEHR